MPNPNGGNSGALSGYLILAGLLVTGLLIFNLHAFRDMFRSQVDIFALVREAPDINAGSPVWVEGIPAGRVTGVEVVRRGDSTFVALALRMDDEVRAVLTRNSDVRAARQRVIGESIVRLRAGAPGETPIQAGDTLRGSTRLTTDELLARGDALPAALDSLRTAALHLQALTERQAPAFDRMVDEVFLTLDALASLRAQAEGGSLARMLDPRGLPARVEELRGRLAQLQDAIAGTMGRYATDPDAAIPAAVARLEERARSVATALDALEARAEAGGGFVFRMQEDSALQVAARGVQAQIDSLTAEAYSIAWRMLIP